MAFRSAPAHARRRRSSRLECVVARAVRRAHPHARHPRGHCRERGAPCRMTLAVGGPTYVLCVLLFALLLYCGLGSLVFGRFAPWLRSRFGSFAIVVALVGVVTAELIERSYRLENVSSPVLRVA